MESDWKFKNCSTKATFVFKFQLSDFVCLDLNLKTEVVKRNFSLPQITKPLNMYQTGHSDVNITSLSGLIDAKYRQMAFPSVLVHLLEILEE